jgi:DNA-binding transcriptional LysR family regulator
MISDALDLHLLRTYVAVCRQGSLSRVAAQTGRAQSAISMQMRRLESQLDRQLLRRTGRGVVPTEDGETFLNYAIRILALGDEAVARLTAEGITGGIRVGLAEEIANVVLPAALARLRRAYPDLHLDISVDHSIAIAKSWTAGDLDLAIATASAFPIDARVTWNVDLLWTCGLDHTPDPARALDVVTYAEPCLWRKRMVDALTTMGRGHRVVLTSQSVSAIQSAVENGLGVAMLTAECIRPETMRVLTPSMGVPDPLVVQYGLYASNHGAPAVEAAVNMLWSAIAPAGRPLHENGSI